MASIDLSNIDIVVITYERQRYALRNMTFWNNTNANVHILDGSKQAISSDTLTPFNENIHYYHLPIGIIDRLKKVLPLLTKKYTLLQSDDEFYSLQGLKKCIEELENDENLVSCCGHAAGFSVDNETNEIIGFEVYPDTNNHSLFQETPAERVYHHMANYTPTHIYAVIRRDVWIKSMEIGLLKEFNIFPITEMQFTMAICFFGKSKVIPELYWFRSFENEPIRGTDPSLDLDKLFFKWWYDKKQDKQELLDIMRDNLAPHVQLTHQELEIIIKNGFEYYARKTRRESKPVYWKIRRTVRRIYLTIIPAIIRNSIKKILFKLRSLSPPKRHSTLISFLKNQHKFSFDLSEVIEYEHFIKRNNTIHKS